MPHCFEEGNARAEHITGVVAGKFPTVSLTNGFNLYVPPPSYYPCIHTFCGAFSAPIQREHPHERAKAAVRLHRVVQGDAAAVATRLHVERGGGRRRLYARRRPG